MKEYYDVCQGKTVNGKWKTPIFPITDQAMLQMLADGIAEALGHEEKTYYAGWGHGIYIRLGKDDYQCVASDWDSSG